MSINMYDPNGLRLHANRLCNNFYTPSRIYFYSSCHYKRNPRPLKAGAKVGLFLSGLAPSRRKKPLPSFQTRFIPGRRHNFSPA